MSDAIPDYLSSTYRWAYLDPGNQRLLDHSLVVDAILWGNSGRLIRWALDEVPPGGRVLQTACVYGPFSTLLAERVGPQGELVVLDIAPNQLAAVETKLAPYPHASTRLADAARQPPDRFDAVVCFFLLHEVPLDYKRRIVDGLLACLNPGGRVVFVDYHRPAPLHPLKPLMSWVYDRLEPFAKELWSREIEALASRPEDFAWSKQTRFGRLYQKVVARRR
ncbi:MAG: methyltransferase domain-containing protein [Alphaproteobacteria bacterium]|nr:methyltransferase domain-containing protein [Alphaproteobacteria bacterium]